MKKVILLNKKEGKTPLEALENFRYKNKEYFGIPMTYAGRLDPMASGLLIILTGEEAKNKQKYLDLNKTYKFSVLFGFATDTYDILGKVVRQDLTTGVNTDDFKKLIKKEIKKFKGKFKQKYPAYSSKTVNGKPLFTYARKGEEVDVPEKEVEIKKIELTKIYKISKIKLWQNIEKRISKVSGDFRQKEILEIWKNVLKDKNRSNVLYVACFKVKASSGTYVRVLANELGKKIGVASLAFKIKREKIGNFSL